jgi:hypothetical protein
VVAIDDLLGATARPDAGAPHVFISLDGPVMAKVQSWVSPLTVSRAVTFSDVAPLTTPARPHSGLTAGFGRC